MPQDDPSGSPTTLVELRLPPTFVAEHCIRTLASQGAMSAVELAKHWRVTSDIVAQVLDPLKAAGMIETDAGRSNLETMQRWRLSAAGQARIATARARTWYAGPLPVSLYEFDRRTRAVRTSETGANQLRVALAPFAFDEASMNDIGQAIAMMRTIAVGGLAHEEQRPFAEALSGTLSGSVELPHAVFAAGAVIRVFDARIHHPQETHPLRNAEDGETEFLRPRDASSRWSTVARPVVRLAGGLLASDVLPSFDDDARFYIAPAALAAVGGLFVVCDAVNSDPAALDGLARHWLVPGRHGSGTVLLRTGERVEVPWRAATALLAHGHELTPIAAAAADYHCDVSSLNGERLTRFLTPKLPAITGVSAASVERIGALLERTGLASRRSAALVAQYLRDRSVYLGADFDLSEEALSAALQFASAHAEGTPARTSRAA